MWWIIIGAVIALVVMIVLMVLFTGKTSALEGGLLDCASKGGQCVSEADCTTSGGTVSRTFQCEDNALKCCFLTKKPNGAECRSNSECSSGICSAPPLGIGQCVAA